MLDRADHVNRHVGNVGRLEPNDDDPRRDPEFGLVASQPLLGLARDSSAPVLAPRTVHVWLFDTDEPEPGHYQRCGDSLSAWERERASRYVRSLDRDGFVVGRGTIRRILGRYLATPPRTIAFDLGEFGKPLLLPATGLHVNWSHSGSLWMLAIAASGPLGVDIECAPSGFDWTGPAAVACGPRELTFIAGTDEAKAPRFLDVWTRKEALFKGVGKGLHDTMHLTSVVDQQGRLVTLMDLATAGSWFITSLPVAPPFGAALATSFPAEHVQLLVERRVQQRLRGAIERSPIPHHFPSVSRSPRHEHASNC